MAGDEPAAEPCEWKTGTRDGKMGGRRWGKKVEVEREGRTRGKALGAKDDKNDVGGRSGGKGGL